MISAIKAKIDSLPLFNAFLFAALNSYEVEEESKSSDRFYFFENGERFSLALDVPSGWDWDKFNRENHVNNFNPDEDACHSPYGCNYDHGLND